MTKIADQSTTTSPYAVESRLCEASAKKTYVSTPARPTPAESVPAERPKLRAWASAAIGGKVPVSAARPAIATLGTIG